MIDLLKAIFIGSFLVFFGFLLIAAWAMLVPVATFGILVLLIFLVIKAGKEPPEDPG